MHESQDECVNVRLPGTNTYRVNRLVADIILQVLTHLNVVCLISALVKSFKKNKMNATSDSLISSVVFFFFF